MSEFNLSEERKIVRDVLIDTLKDMVKVETIMKEIERVDEDFIKKLKEVAKLKCENYGNFCKDINQLSGKN